MKATLEFSLPEETQEHYDAVNGSAFKHCLIEIDQELRSFLKYGHDYKTADAALTRVREFLWECVNDNNLTLE
jgi:hypothetical protein